LFSLFIIIKGTKGNNKKGYIPLFISRKRWLYKNRVVFIKSLPKRCIFIILEGKGNNNSQGRVKKDIPPNTSKNGVNFCFQNSNRRK